MHAYGLQRVTPQCTAVHTTACAQLRLQLMSNISKLTGICLCGYVVWPVQPRSSHQFVFANIANKLKQWFSCFCCSAVSPADLTDLPSDSGNWKPLEDADKMWSTLRGRGKRASGDGANAATNTAATKKPPVPTRGSVKDMSPAQKRSEVRPSPCLFLVLGPKRGSCKQQSLYSHKHAQLERTKADSACISC